MCEFYTIEVFSKIFFGWEVCAIDVNFLSACVLSNWNPFSIDLKPYQTCAGILLDGKLKGLKQIFFILNYYGPYKY